MVPLHCFDPHSQLSFREARARAEELNALNKDPEDMLVLGMSVFDLPTLVGFCGPRRRHHATRM